MMELNQFSQYTNIENFQGKKYGETPISFRNELYHHLTPEEYNSFTLGRADTEVIKKVQLIYDDWFNETHPTDFDLYNRRREAEARDNIENLKRTLKRTKERLAKLDYDAKMDMKLPYGLRESLRKEIAGLERQLQVNKSVSDSGTTSTESDWLDSFFTE